MSYGILLWGRAADIETIFILQKRAIRAIYKLGYRESLKELFKEINILTVASQYIYENIMYVRKNLMLFPKIHEHCNVNVRNKNKLSFPKQRLSKVNSSFMGHCIRFYNKIPDDIVNLPDSRFKGHIKTTLCKKGYYTINAYLIDKYAWSTPAHL